MLGELKLVRDDMINLKHKVETTEKTMFCECAKRKNRGLFNGVGEGLRFLFGTAVDSQLITLQNEIYKLNYTTSVITHHEKLQLTYLNRTQHMMQRHESILHHLTKALDETDAELTKEKLIVYRLQEKIDTQNQLLISTFSLSQALHSRLDAVHIDVDRRLHALHSAAAGKVSPFLFDTGVLVTTLQEISDRLPRPLTLLHRPILSEIPNHIDSMTASVVVLDKKAYIYVSIPLVTHNSYFTLYESKPFPFLHKNNNVATIIIPESRYIGVSRDQSRFIFPDLSFLHKCRAGLQLVCPPSIPSYGASAKMCLIAAYHSDQQRVQSLCRKKAKTIPYATFIEGTGPGEWIYSVSDMITFAVTCPRPFDSESQHLSSPKRMTINNIGTLQLPSGCMATSNEYALMSHNNLGKVTATSETDIVPQEIEFPKIIIVFHSRHPSPDEVNTSVAIHDLTGYLNSSLCIPEELRPLTTLLQSLQDDLQGRVDQPMLSTETHLAIHSIALMAAVLRFVNTIHIVRQYIVSKRTKSTRSGAQQEEDKTPEEQELYPHHTAEQQFQ
jgi:hypothetical protein